MALGDDVGLVFDPTTETPTLVVPASGIAQWVKAIDAGGLDDADIEGGVIQNPVEQITRSTTHILLGPKFGGTTLRVLMSYDEDDLVDTSDPPPPPLTIRVFGKQNAQDFWVALRNLNGDASVPVQINPATDTLEPTAGQLFTVPDNNAHSWDCDGCDRFLIGVENAYQPAAGASPDLAILWAKIV